LTFFFLTRFHTFHQGFKVGQSLTFAEGELEIVSPDSGDGSAVFIKGFKIDHRDFPVLGLTGFADSDNFAHVGAQAFHHGGNVAFSNFGLFLLHRKAFVSGQVKVGQDFKGNAVDKIIVPHQVAAVIINAGHRGECAFPDDLIDMHVDQIRGGFLVNLAMKALFNDACGHLALAEAIQGDGRAVHGKGGGNGGIDFFRGYRNGNFFLYWREVFTDILHRYITP
jgi:hypothetical protein